MSDKSIICEVCGQKKTSDEMSKSYKHRCKACVAEMARKNRLIDKGIQGIHASTLLIDEPKIDIATAEVRLTETAISALIKKNDGRIMQYECEEIGRQAVAIAHSALLHMKYINKE